MTKISPWKVQEFADEEGPQSPFATLSSNLTQLLSTILLITTACSIYSTALFVATASEIFPNASLGLITAALTAVTLFFGELLPKALAVSNSELVARKTVPAISRLATVLFPITSVVTFGSDLVLRLAGMRSSKEGKEDDVSEDMLRMVVDEAQRSDTGIDTGEGRMIKAVLDMQDKAVGKIMKPRVDIVGVSETDSASDILKIVVENRYSRIPVYKGDVDNVVGIVYSKDLLEVFSRTLVGDEHDLGSPIAKSSSNIDTSEKHVTWKDLTAELIMEPTYFIPETMTAWTALQEMRKRRLHMAIVVDEYGGTAGLVTFEDILEEVVGEIYDEDDDEEEVVERQNITRNTDGTFEMKGVADLDDVIEALGMLVGEDDLGEYSTIGGYLCSQAGAIPTSGDVLEFSGYRFTVREVEDNRRILSLSAERLYGDKESGEFEKDHNGKADKGSFTPPFLKGLVDSESHSSQESGGEGGGSEAGGSSPLTFLDGAWVEVERTGSSASGGGSGSGSGDR